MDPVFFENIIIQLLFKSGDVRERVMPFLSTRVFTESKNIAIVKTILKFTKDYNKFPTQSEMKLLVGEAEVYEKLADNLSIDLSEYDDSLISNEIEDYFRKKLILDEITNTADHLSSDKMDRVSMAPERIREALSFGFNTEIGLDFLDSEDRLYNFLHSKDKVIPTGIPVFDEVIDGGFHEKSLTLFMAETNLGKSLIMASLAVNCLLKNKNVLYVTCEMSEDKISERMMANLFDIAVDDLKLLTRKKFSEKYGKIQSTLKNKLYVKEYAPRSINVGHIRNLLRELENKKKFVPDIIFVDYIGIMLPVLERKEDNTYTEQKRISEEIRGLAVESGLPVVSAVQTNRKGFGDSEIDLTDISDSIGTAATADVIIGVTQSQEYRSLGKYAWIVLKNRYGINKRKIVVSVNYFKMRVYQDDDDEGESNGSSVTEMSPRQSSPKENAKKVDDAAGMVANFIDRSKTIGQTIVEFEDED